MAKAEKEPRIPVRLDPDRLSVPAARVLEKLKPDLLIFEFTADERFPRGRRFTAMPCGKPVPIEDAEELIAKGKFRPVGDGLFPETTQQYERAS